MIPLLLAATMVAGPSGHVNCDPVPVILDTDGAPDDLRAVCLLLAGENTEVLAVTTSGGSVSAADAMGKLRALLEDLGRDDIPIASGRELAGEPPPWRSFARRVGWGEATLETNGFAGESAEPNRGALALITGILERSERGITIVCLGSLANLADVLQERPELEEQIERVVWYNDEIDPLRGTNYSFDPDAADMVFGTGIRIDVISNTGEDAPAFDSSLLERISEIDNVYAQRIAVAHHQEEVFALVAGGHFKLWDDLVPVYLVRPSLFAVDKVSVDPLRQIVKSFDEAQVRMEILGMLDGTGFRNVTLADFPDAPDQFRDDLAPYVDAILKRHGHEEWRLAVITSEMHQHLGIYSLVGVKMGLRAREILGVGLDELEVTSYAGSKPPISCMNDGLQVSTGATLGHGMITVAAGSETRPRAGFAHSERSVTLSLKDEYWKAIREAIADVQKKGAVETYFADLRKAAVAFWLEWDRNQIFDVESED